MAHFIGWSHKAVRPARRPAPAMISQTRYPFEIPGKSTPQNVLQDWRIAEASYISPASLQPFM
jgi:hypothetical protein